MFLLIVLTMVAFVSRRLSAGSNAAPGPDQASAQRQQNLLRSLQQTFAGESQQGVVAVKGARTHIQVAISAQLLFPQHGTELWPGGRNILRRLAQTLRASPGAGYQRIEVEGHTDRDGFAAAAYPRDNWELSSGQAVSALKYLAAETGLNAALFSAHGYADLRPPPASQAQPRQMTDRRVEVNIFFGAAKP
ncbi:MAG TPA: OmpA family protein [Pyrinomonadaceae bacterium]|nr:OmpA family protein [Pyrinomonadaceae bacterium]